jgi:hypothetical protein
MIEELKALAEKSTPGPWDACKEGKCRCGQIWSIPADQQVGTILAEWGDAPDMIYGGVGEEQREANAALIVALVNNLPAILSALEAVPVMKEATDNLGEALFHLSDKLRGSGFLNDDANHAEYEKVVAAFQALAALEKRHD